MIVLNNCCHYGATYSITCSCHACHLRGQWLLSRLAPRVLGLGGQLSPANLLSLPPSFGPSVQAPHILLALKEGRPMVSWVGLCPLSSLHMAHRSPRERFYMAAPLCRAVQHAHGQSRLWCKCTSCPGIIPPRLAGTAEGDGFSCFSSLLGSWGKEKINPLFSLFYASYT